MALKGRNTGEAAMGFLQGGPMGALTALLGAQKGEKRRAHERELASRRSNMTVTHLYPGRDKNGKKLKSIRTTTDKGGYNYQSPNEIT